MEAIYTVLQEGISPQDPKRADNLLQAFTRNVQVLYGKRFMSLNVHNLTHLVRFVSEWGPLWAWSCFCFESFNREIMKSIHGIGNVCKQVYWTLQTQTRVVTKAAELNKSSRVLPFVRNMMDGNPDR